jgi:hypothetical protein
VALNGPKLGIQPLRRDAMMNDGWQPLNRSGKRW